MLHHVSYCILHPSNVLVIYMDLREGGVVTELVYELFACEIIIKCELLIVDIL